MRSKFVASALGVLGLVAAAGLPASAAPESTFVSHFTGRAGSAILTDCVGVAAGGHCRAVDVFAFEQRVNEDGVRFGGPGVSVILYDVAIVSTDPLVFVPTVVGVGFTDDASVDIATNLSAGSARAADVPLDPAGSLSVEVSWAGAGPISRFRIHDMFAGPSFFANSRSSGTSRAADASGTLDGAPVEDVALFPSSLQTDRFGTVFHTRSLATMSATAAAASVGHTSETSGSATMTDCPPAPPVGTTCDGMSVSAVAFQADRRGPVQGRVFADFYELTVTDEGFDAVFVGFGFDEEATVAGDAALTRLVADAELARFACGELDCTPAGTSALRATWIGTGDTEPFRFHSQFHADGTRDNVVGRGRLRAAEADATLDGQVFTQVADFPAALRHVDITANSN